MACFIVPATEAVVTTIAARLLEKKENKKMAEDLKKGITVAELHKETLSSKLRGHYQYYGVTDNTNAIQSFYHHTKKLLYKWLNRRSQKRSYNSEGFNSLLKTFGLPAPKIYVSLFYRRVTI